MKQRKLWGVLALLLAVVFTLSYFGVGKVSAPKKVSLPETVVQHLELASPILSNTSELSGLAWYGDDLILLPQYPSVFGNDDGYLFYIPKEQILNYLDGKDREPLEAGPLRLIANGLTDKIPDFQGFESVGFSGDRVFLTIKAGTNKNVHGYLVSGIISPDRSKLTLDSSRITEIPTQAKSGDHSDEALLILDDRIITFYETLGADLVEKPVAHVFDLNLNPLDTIPMENLEYRLTDAAWADGKIFWGINYFSPDDADLLPETDPIYEKYGTGETHAQYDQIERLVAFEYSDEGIRLADRAPILFKLYKDANNWEGLTTLDDRGFLVVTDKFPATILGFVPFP